ncbi:unnamed protein product [Colias eurytheme]|nr:unnamed protein product [Colias eurytheme]
MTLLWLTVTTTIVLSIGLKCVGWIAPIEKEHNYFWETYKRPNPQLECGETLDNSRTMTPDFREEEPPWTAHTYKYREHNRPYRLSPYWQMTKKFSSYDIPSTLGCGCCVVYKRLTPLSACAVITSRHFLTSASSVALVLSGHGHLKTLENILGVWYDHGQNVGNSSFYASIARIHFHPQFSRPELVNRSHPLPAVFDLAVMASTYNVYGYYLWTSSAPICPRGAGHTWEAYPPTPRDEMVFAVGYQFMWATKRKPTPFHKYFVRTRDYVVCPKTEWGWFICLTSHQWARFGMDSGGPLFRCFEGYSWRYDGLVAMHSFGMKLRSDDMLLYYTILDCHPVLDFLYQAYNGRLPYEYLDFRFDDTQWGAPRPKRWAYIKHDYTLGSDFYTEKRWW